MYLGTMKFFVVLVFCINLAKNEAQNQRWSKRSRIAQLWLVIENLVQCPKSGLECVYHLKIYDPPVGLSMASTASNVLRDFATFLGGSQNNPNFF